MSASAGKPQRMSSAASDDLTRIGPVPAVVYAAMLAATTGGQLLGITFDVLLGSRGIWAPVACSVGLEALVAARLSAQRLGRQLSGIESARVSVYYSLALAALSAVLAVWIAAARPGPAAPDGASPGLSSAVATWAVAFAVGTLARWGLMVALSGPWGSRPGEGR